MKAREMTNRNWKFLSGSVMKTFFLVAAIANTVYAQSMQEPSSSLNLSKYKLSLVYLNNFSEPQEIVFEPNLTGKLASGEWIRTSTPGSRAVWVAEGLGGVDIRGGKLRVLRNHLGRPLQSRGVKFLFVKSYR